MPWWTMILTMIVVQVVVMPFVGAASLSHVYFSVNQGWMGAAMGAAMMLKSAGKPSTAITVDTALTILSVVTFN